MSVKRAVFVVPILLLSTPALVLSQANQGQSKAKAVALKPAIRLVYKNTQISDVSKPGIAQLCLALRQDGNYRLWRSTTTGHTEALGGTLQKDELKQLNGLLNNAELTVWPGHIVRGLTQTLMLEMPSGKGVERRSWVADQANPFPDSVGKIAAWLQKFTPEGAKRLDVSQRDVCPAARNWPVPPAAAR